MTNQFRKYLKLLRRLANEMPLDRVVYEEGSTVSNVAFHAAQSTNNFLRVHVLRTSFDRNKPAEYGEQHTLDEINNSLDMAFEACDLIDEKAPDMNEKLVSPIEIDQGSVVIDTNLGALTFSLSHLAEHCGELMQVEREIKSKANK